MRKNNPDNLRDKGKLSLRACLYRQVEGLSPELGPFYYNSQSRVFLVKKYNYGKKITADIESMD